jgi:hypothetical protein
MPLLRLYNFKACTETASPPKKPYLLNTLFGVRPTAKAAAALVFGIIFHISMEFCRLMFLCHKPDVDVNGSPFVEAELC